VDLSVVIPVYNSEPIVLDLVRRLVGAMQVQTAIGDYEVILINDASTDASWPAIERACELYPQFRGLNLRRNAGQHNAIMAGLRHATGDVIVVMDDDLQHAPEDISKLYATIRNGSDLCYAAFQEPRQARWKTLGSRFRDFTARHLLGVPRGVRISSFKGILGDVAREATRYDGPFPYVDGLLLMATSNVATVVVEHYPRREGRGNYGLSESIQLWTKVAMNFSVLPLRIASWLGLAFAALGFVAAGYLVFQKLAYDEIPVPGWSSLVVVILIAGGVQLLALGAIGEYLGRAYVQLNRKPQYVIKATKGFPDRPYRTIS
jgi:undecaprenyl-phosphate 4-deoxy-4-formamido-L-arabinose transferase